jgi:hypothetical protein
VVAHSENPDLRKASSICPSTAGSAKASTPARTLSPPTSRANDARLGLQKHQRRMKSMSVDVYYDADGSCKDPRTAIEILAEDRPGYLVRHGFIHMWNGVALPPAASLNGAEAILIMGTTAELQQDLRWAVQYGMTAVNIPNDQLAIYYVRRPTKDKTMTVVSIAPLQRYWGNYTNAYNLGWRDLYPSQIFNGGISLDTLVVHILPTVQGQTGWVRI